MSATLKPCPFCGGAPVMRQTVEEYAAEGDYPAGEFPAWFTIHCDECGIEKGEEYRADAIAAWNRRTDGWCADINSAPEHEVHNVVGRYPDATAGFPRYAAKIDGEWLEYSRHAPQPLIVWAWRPRSDWPREPSLAPEEVS